MSPVPAVIPPGGPWKHLTASGEPPAGRLAAEARGLPELLQSSRPTQGPSPSSSSVPCLGEDSDKWGEGAGSCLHPSFPSRKRIFPYSPPAGPFSKKSFLKMISCLEHISLRPHVQALRFHGRVTISCTSGTARGSYCFCLRLSCQDGFLILHNLIYKGLCAAVEGGPPTRGPSAALFLVLPLLPPTHPHWRLFRAGWGLPLQWSFWKISIQEELGCLPTNSLQPSLDTAQHLTLLT